MVRNFWRRSVSVARNPRLRLEALEGREVPAIIQNGLPSWLSAGPTAIQNNQPDGITGTVNDPAAGPVTGVAPDPTDANRTYVGTGGGGIWRTENAQAADPVYTPLTDNLPSLSVSAISLNPADPNQLVAGLGRLSVFPYNGTQVSDLVGLLYTENARDPSPSFRVLGANTPVAGLNVTQVVVRTGYILVTGYDFDGATANDGTYLSRDRGFTFTRLDGTGGLPAQVGGGLKSYDLVTDPADVNRVYLAGQSGLYRTDNVLGNLGQVPVWTPLTSPLFTLGAATANARLAIHNSAGGNVVYLTTAGPAVRGNQLNGVFYSTNRGTNWTEMDIPVQVEFPQTIEDVSNATPISIKSSFHGLITGERVQISGVTGNLAANGVWTITRTGRDDFTLDGSVGTGVYAGGGTWQQIYGVNSFGLGEVNQTIVADPTNPNLVYVGGTFSFGSTANIMRGDRSAPRGFNAIAPSFQWTPIVGNGALGSSPAGFAFDSAFDANGNLLDADEGGLYRRAAPEADLSAWTNAAGNITASHFATLAYDSNSNVILSGTYGTGGIEQSSGAGPVGDPLYNTITFGDHGSVAVDNISSPGVSIRYISTGAAGSIERRAFNAKNVQVGSTTFLRFASPTDPISFKGLEDNTANIVSRQSRFVLNLVDPRQAMLAITDKLYEDNDPAGNAGDVVAKVTPAGLTGFVSSITYGGRQNGLNLARIAYVGTDSGQLFLRGAAGGFNALTVPGKGAIRSVAVDPDNWRNAFVLRGSTELLDPAQFVPTAIYQTTDAGATWLEVTENLFTKVTDNSGNPVGGFSSDIRTLTLWDAAPGDSVGGNTVLLAGGAGGVYRYVPSIVDPTTATGGWTEFGAGLPNAVVSSLVVNGNRLIAGTLGRGVWEIPDISPTIRAAAVVTVQGTDGDDTFTFGGSGGSSGTVFLSDGQGSSLFVSRNTGATFSFVGGKGADTLTVGTSGQPGGDLQFLSGRVVVDLGNNPGDTLIVSNQGRAVPTNVTVTSNTVGAGGADNLFAPGAVLVYSGLSQGTLRIDLGTQVVSGNLVNVQSTSAGTTQLLGTNGADAFVLNGKAGTSAETGDLLGFFGTVTVDGRGVGTFGGGNTLRVSDLGATSGNANANLVGDQILGLAGPTDAAVISYAKITDLSVIGSDSATLAESFRVENPAAPLTLANKAGPDAVNVRAANNPVTLTGGPGAVVFRVTSTAGDNLDGDLNGIAAAVTVNAGAGDSQLVISNYGNLLPSQYAVTASSIAGATPVPIRYTSAGRFAAAGGNGLWLRGSNTANDTFNVAATLGNGTQTAIDGNGGDDVFNVGADSLGGGGTVTLRAGAGSNNVAIDSGVFGVTADLLTIAGAGGTTRAAVLGFDLSDKVTPTLAVTDTVNGRFTGVGKPIAINSLAFFDYDGRGGRNDFLYQDATNASFGSVANPEAGIVYQPKGVASGEIRLAGVGPVVNVSNINGSDAGGLVIDGDANRVGALDTVTVVGVSDANLVPAGPLGGTSAPNGADQFEISDVAVTLFNESLGQLRSVAVVPGTVRTLIVKGGNEAARGDTFTVTPSASLDILVDGEGPARKRDGNTLKINTTESTRIERSPNPFFGTVQTRIVTAGGASVAFKNFPNATGLRSIYAVGADAGGGPRVRVYDAVTKEVLFDRFVYDPAFTGGVRVATGDVTGDGVPDLVVAAGVGGGPHIQVFDGVTFESLTSFFAYENTFRGGTFVSIGDFNGDGVGDILVGSGNGGGPVVKVFDGTGRALTAFFAYDKNFRGGVRVAAGDVNGDGKDDIVTGAGPGGGPNVRVFNASDLRILTQYNAFDPSFTGGIYVAAGDVNGDGTADIVAGPGDNSVAIISIRDSRTGLVTPLNVFDIGVIANPDPLPPSDSDVLNASSGLASELGGIRVAVADLAASGAKQIVVSRGPGSVSRIRTYTVNPLAEAGNFLAFEPEFTGGVYVG